MKLYFTMIPSAGIKSPFPVIYLSPKDIATLCGLSATEVKAAALTKHMYRFQIEKHDHNVFQLTRLPAEETHAGSKLTWVKPQSGKLTFGANVFMVYDNDPNRSYTIQYTMISEGNFLCSFDPSVYKATEKRLKVVTDTLDLVSQLQTHSLLDPKLVKAARLLNADAKSGRLTLAIHSNKLFVTFT